MATKAELEAQIEHLTQQNRQLLDALLQALQAKPYTPPAVVVPTITTPQYPGYPRTYPTTTSTYPMTGTLINLTEARVQLGIVRRDDDGPESMGAVVNA